MKITITDEEVAKFTAMNVAMAMTLTGSSMNSEAFIQLKNAIKTDFHSSRLKIDEMFEQVVLSGYGDN
jgi:hypothetical protein